MSLAAWMVIGCWVVLVRSWVIGGRKQMVWWVILVRIWVILGQDLVQIPGNVDQTFKKICYFL